MKKIFKFILGIIASLLIPGIFGGVGAGVYFWLIAPHIEAKKIIKTGFETTATIIDMDSNLTYTSKTGNITQKTRIYYLRLIFVNSEKKEIEYKTYSIYPENFLNDNNVRTGNTVRVMYLNDKAVIKGFVPEYKIWLLLFPVVFGAIAIGFIVLFIVSMIMEEKDNIIKRSGTLTTSTYSDKKQFINAKDFDLYCVICTLQNDIGDIIEVRTRFLYNNSEIKKFAKMGSFPIMYQGERAVIMIEEENKE